jgi:hypothetical protein
MQGECNCLYDGQSTSSICQAAAPGTRMSDGPLMLVPIRSSISEVITWPNRSHEKLCIWQMSLQPRTPSSLTPQPSPSCTQPLNLMGSAQLVLGPRRLRVNLKGPSLPAGIRGREPGLRTHGVTPTEELKCTHRLKRRAVRKTASPQGIRSSSSCGSPKACDL